ncbi:Ig-like domain-containing protein [uncultured Polaribacter sp.]|uniref:tandem-95 repeat protein n=1 Tax=uncultured Polaribacter sp. TaxID=174711 RepID=UPI00262A754F|nr:Ig-like domain-containing protein [uncultured Polaribacter sp.]
MKKILFLIYLFTICSVNAQFIELPLTDKITSASAIVEGKIIDVDVSYGKDSLIYTTYYLEVYKNFKGLPSNTENIRIVKLGGIIGDDVLEVSPSLDLYTGEVASFFLKNSDIEFLEEENSDIDGDGIPNTEDLDDDGDGINTIDEDVQIVDQDPTNDDTDGDTIPNYLDNDDDGDGILTLNEDVNNDGDYTNDDTDEDGIPNYLDAEDSPITNDDLGNVTPEDAELTITNILGNDIDNKTLDAINITLFSMDSSITGGIDTPLVIPNIGTYTLTTSGDVVFTPLDNYSGDASINYSVTDEEGLASNVSNIEITVTPVNDAPLPIADSYSTIEDTILEISVDEGLLVNDSDIEGDPLMIISINYGGENIEAGNLAELSQGALQVNSDGSFSFEPEQDFNGNLEVTYLMSDGDLMINSTLTITVSPVNDAPVTLDDFVSIEAGTSINIDVLANDLDIDSDILTIDSIEMDPEQGVVTINTDQTITYTPQESFIEGIDVFTYKVCDGDGLCGTAQVQVTVSTTNEAPIANADAYSSNEDEVLNVDVTNGLLANDTDANQDDLMITGITVDAVDYEVGLEVEISRGTITVNADGSFSFLPQQDFNGEVLITYLVSDGVSEVSSEVKITILPVNDAPVALSDEYTFISNQVTTIAKEDGVLKNDTDVEGSVLTVTEYKIDQIIYSAGEISETSFGSFKLNTDGSLEINSTFVDGTTTINPIIYTISDGLLTTQAEINLTEDVVGVEDQDQDGVADTDEDINFDNDLTNDDTDGDGTPNYLDSDDDGDGVSTLEEDIDSDGTPTNDDTDADGIPNYLDTDDDGDGVSTLNEDVDSDGNPTNDDTDGDEIPNYLDTDDDGDGIDTKDEDLNQDGDPTNDDSDGDGIPNYLDPNQNKSNVKNVILKNIALYEAVSSTISKYTYDCDSGVVTNPFITFQNLNEFYQELENSIGSTYEEVSSTTPCVSVSSKTVNTMSISGMSPSIINAGTKELLTINGTNFGTTLTNQTLWFRNNSNPNEYKNIPNSEIKSWSDTKIEVYVPYYAGTGKIALSTTSSGNKIYSSNTVTVPYAQLNSSYKQTQHIDSNSNGGYTFSLNTDFAANTAAKEAFERAMETWSCNTSMNWEIGNTVVTDTQTTRNGVNTVMFDSTMSASQLGVCYSRWGSCSSTGDRVVTEIDIIFNPNVNWNYTTSNASGSQYDFETVALHELGHGRQIKHMIDDTKTMHFSLAKGDVRRTLTNDEVDGGLDIQSRSNSIVVCGQNLMTDYSCATNSVSDFNSVFSVYPNPVRTTLTVESSNDTVNNLKIFNVNGSLIRHSKTNTISVDNLVIGVYILKIETPNGIMTQKIIKE